MILNSLSHLSDAALSRDLDALVSTDCITTAALLAHLAEFDDRKLYVPAGYHSMSAYCMEHLRFSNDVAYKRIRAARAARKIPAILAAVADARLHLTAVVLLAPHLAPENADDLLAAATHKTRAEIEELIATRFPRTETLSMVEVAKTPGFQLAAEPVDLRGAVPSAGDRAAQLAPEPVRVASQPRVVPIAAERFHLPLVMGQRLRDKLRYAEELGPVDPAEVFERGLDACIAELEKRKFGATNRPQRRPRPTQSKRHVPAEVKRTVWRRDDGKCTFVSETGHHCSARKHLQFDHIEPVARGGLATVENIRLRCPAHNQYEAECAFGAGFMERKRSAARRPLQIQAGIAEGQRVRDSQVPAKTASTERTARATALMETPPELDVTPWLRKLGFRVEETRRAAAHCADYRDASLEQRVVIALRFLGP